MCGIWYHCLNQLLSEFSILLVHVIGVCYAAYARVNPCMYYSLYHLSFHFRLCSLLVVTNVGLNKKIMTLYSVFVWCVEVGNGYHKTTESHMSLS